MPTHTNAVELEKAQRHRVPSPLSRHRDKVPDAQLAPAPTQIHSHTNSVQRGNSQRRHVHQIGIVAHSRAKQTNAGRTVRHSKKTGHAGLNTLRAHTLRRVQPKNVCNRRSGRPKSTDINKGIDKKRTSENDHLDIGGRARCSARNQAHTRGRGKQREGATQAAKVDADSARGSSTRQMARSDWFRVCPGAAQVDRVESAACGLLRSKRARIRARPSTRHSRQSIAIAKTVPETESVPGSRNADTRETENQVNRHGHAGQAPVVPPHIVAYGT
jgi:hypothetical protein